MVVEIQHRIDKQLIDWYFLKHVNLENIQQELRRCRKVQSLARDDDDDIGADGDPDLRLDRVDGIAEEMFDRQVLLEIYFTSKSVVLLKRGVAEGLFAGPRERATVYSFMQHAARHGAKFFACSQALQEHGVSPEDLIAEVSGVAGAAAYIARCVDARWTALTY